MRINCPQLIMSEISIFIYVITLCLTCCTWAMRPGCVYHDWRATGNASMTVPRRSNSSTSCAVLCAVDPNCTAVNYDQGTDSCELYVDEGAASPVWEEATGALVWIFRRPLLCNVVSKIVLCAIHVQRYELKVQ